MATKENLILKINNGDNKAFRELYGNDPAELKRNAKRYTGLLNSSMLNLERRIVNFSPPRAVLK